MAQTGYTPIQLYYSTTTTNTPLAGDLVYGELALNAADGKLFYKDSATNTVKLLASNSSTTNVASFSAGTTGLTPSTATTGVVTLGGTLITSNGGTGLSSYTAGDMLYYATGTALSKLTIGTSGYLLTSSGTAPQWSQFLAVANGGTGQTTYTDGQLLIGNSTGNTLTKATLTAGSGVSITNGNGSITIAATGSGGTVTSVSFTGGIISVATATTTPALTVAGTSGGIPYFSSGTTWASSGALAANAIVIGGGAGAAPSTTTTGTGVLTALGNNANATGGFTTINGTATLTNKRIDPRVSSTSSTASITPDISSFDQYCVTAQAATLTINAPTGTPVDGNKLIFRILDNGTSRTLSWNGTYTAIGVTLPTATTINKTTYVGCIYNANNTRWDVIAVTTQA